MVRRLLPVLLGAVGKTYEPAPDLPLRLILAVVLQRAVWLLRGMLRLRSAVFLGAGVKLRNGGGVRFGRFATVEPGCQVDGYATDPVSIGARTKIGALTIISCTSHLSKLGKGIAIGSDCGISEYCYFGAAGGISIGDNVIMGQYVSFHSENHLFSDPSRLIRSQGVTSKGIRVGNNVWIGAKATILDGSVIGDNSVVAAGAVVKGEFPANSLIGGVPARVMREISASTEA